MYDTVNFWLYRTEIRGDHFVVANYLSDVVEHYDEIRGRSITGKIGNYSVRISELGISIQGSLAEFILLSNIYTLTRCKAKRAIEKLSDCLGIDMRQAKVTRLDVATVLETKRPPHDYFICLSSKPHFERLETSKNTLEYRTAQRTLIFYDKLIQMINKAKKIPEVFDMSNLLRYEVRFIRNPRKQLNVPNLNGHQLTEEHFYHSMIQRWKDEYELIKKVDANQVEISKITTPKKAQDVLFASLLKEKGQSFIDNYMSTLKGQRVFDDSKYYTRTYNTLNDLITMKGIEKIELIKELDSLIDNVVKYAE